MGAEPDPPLQIDEISPELRFTLWNIFYNGFFIKYDNASNVSQQDKYYQILKIIWFRYLKRPIDEIDDLNGHQIKSIFKKNITTRYSHPVVLSACV